MSALGYIFWKFLKGVRDALDVFFILEEHMH